MKVVMSIYGNLLFNMITIISMTMIVSSFTLSKSLL